MVQLFQSSFKSSNKTLEISCNSKSTAYLDSLLSISLQLEGTTEAGVDVIYVPKPFKFPQAALKKYLLPCVNSIVQFDLVISKISVSPVIGEKSALVDH